MKIAFISASEGTHPVGGHKILYEYANRLSARGHEVKVVHFASVTSQRDSKTLRGFLRPLRYLPLAIRGNWKPDNWFKVSPSVDLRFYPTFARMFMPQADAYVAGWWTTAERLGSANSVVGRRLYLIQHLETWAGPEADVMATWRAPLEKIVIARWLEQVAEGLGEPCHYIPNGLDFVKFGCDVAPEARSPRRLAMLYNDRVTWKGSLDGIAACSLLKEKYPDFEAEIFGEQVRPSTLPSWITYHRLPAQQELRRIYNDAAIFLAPSYAEGWGLPPAEAMTCGAAVVATDIGGHREFCIDGHTALLVPAKSPEALASAVGKLIENNDLRLQIAKNGCEHIQTFTWKAAIDAFERVLAIGEQN